MKTVPAARLLAATLHGYGIDHIFFMDAILRRSLGEMEDFGIRRILAHSEKAAAYMADGYARARRTPGVCMAQSVGAANLAAGLQDAYLAGTSIVALSGRHVAANQYRNAYQEIPHEPLFTPVTKMTARAESPGQMAHLLRQAFREASTGRTRPVHLDVAGNTGSATDQADVDVPFIVEPEYGRVPAWRLRADETALARAADVISAAQRPAIVAGMGVVTSAAEQALREFAERLAMPTVATLDAKAVLTAAHPLYAGIVGTYSCTCANRLVAEADLIVFVGCDAGDQATNLWTLPRAETPIIQIDIDASDIGRNFGGTIGVQGDPRAVLSELKALLRPAERPEWLLRTKELVAEWSAEIEAACRSDDVPIRPERLARELGEWLPEDAIVVADTGYSSHWSGTLMPMRHGGQQYFRAAGSLGWAFPAALGAKCAAPDRPVICFTGDGGFMYHLPELETAKRWGLNTITVVNNNHCLAQGVRNLSAAYGSRVGRKEELFVYDELDFAKIAADFGCIGFRIEKPSELVQALVEGSRASAPVVIDVRTDPGAFAPLPWMPER